MKKVASLARNFLRSPVFSSRSYQSDGYDLLMERFDHCVIPLTNNEILETMMKSVLTEEQARFLSRVPAGFVFKSDMYKKMEGEMTIQEVDDMMASLFDIAYLYENNEHFFNFPEMVIGWWEWFWMRDPQYEFDREQLAELSKEYIFSQFVPKIGELAEYPNDMVRNFRTLVREDLVSDMVEILDYESAERVIKNCDRIAVGLCGCQTNENYIHPEANLDEKYPRRRCMVLDWEGNPNASCLEKYGVVEFISHEEALEILENAKEMGLVQNTDNSKNPSFLCQCPKEVCYMFEAYNNKTLANAMCTSRFVAKYYPEKCISCGKCEERCVANCFYFDSEDPKMKQDCQIYFNDEYCLGCGVCVYSCKQGAVELVLRPEDEIQKIFVPEDTLSKNMHIARDMFQVHAVLFGDHEKMWHRWAGKTLGRFEKSGLGKKIFRSEQVMKVAKKVYVANLERRIRKEKALLDE